MGNTIEQPGPDDFKAKGVTEDQDTEGHRASRASESDETPGPASLRKLLAVPEDDADVEGHRAR